MKIGNYDRNYQQPSFCFVRSKSALLVRIFNNLVQTSCVPQENMTRWTHENCKLSMELNHVYKYFILVYNIGTPNIECKFILHHSLRYLLYPSFSNIFDNISLKLKYCNVLLHCVGKFLPTLSTVSYIHEVPRMEK